MGRPGSQQRVLDHPETGEMSLQRVLEAVADPVRRSILRQLADAGEDLSCGAFDLPVSRSTSTHHFNLLRVTGLVRQYYVGTAKMNALRVEAVEARFPGVITSVIAAARAEVASL